MSSVEERLQALEDRDAIGALLAEYRRALDEKDFEAYADLFGDDGEFVTDGRRRGARGDPRMLAELQAAGALSVAAGDDRHLVANVQIAVDGDRATAREHVGLPRRAGTATSRSSRWSGTTRTPCAGPPRAGGSPGARRHATSPSAARPASRRGAPRLVAASSSVPVELLGVELDAVQPAGRSP